MSRKHRRNKKKWIPDTVRESLPVTKKPIFYVMMAPEMPLTVMDLEDCFQAMPSFGIDDYVIDLPDLGLHISTTPHAVVCTDGDLFLIGPSIIFRKDKFGQDIAVTVPHIYALQAFMVERRTTLHCGKYDVPALRIAKEDVWKILNE